MITAALQHCAGIGPVRLARLHDSGLYTWNDCLERPHHIPECLRKDLLNECQQCLAALEVRDVQYFLENFVSQDKWRVLHHFLDETTYFDIETAGLELDAPITVIACWHRGALHTFVEHENLDQFLDLLDEVVLLASFNGSTFDVPRVLDAFHLPKLPCPHLDLRWPCRQQGQVGGLKEIAGRMGIHRPVDLDQADGALAVDLWFAWQHQKDQVAREYLIRYCASDVLLLIALAERLTDRITTPLEDLWNLLPAEPHSPGTSLRLKNRPDPTAQRVLGAMFGKSSPQRLRGRRPRTPGIP